MQMVLSGKATLVAALPSIPTLLPTKIWSTMLYSAPTSSDRMHGSENLRISAPTGCSARKELDWDSFMLASDFPPKGKKTAHAARVPANLGSRHTPRSHTVSYPNAVHPCIVPSSQI